MADPRPMPSFPRLSIEGDDTLVFGTAGRYKFKDKRLLEEACTMRYSPKGITTPHWKLPKNNQHLALVGDTHARGIIVDRWYESDEPIYVYQDLYCGAMAMNRYLAQVADVCGIMDIMMVNGQHSSNFAGAFSDHDKGTAVEAIFGAIWTDRKGESDQQRALEWAMEQFGVFWPKSSKDAWETKRVIHCLRWHNVI